jgi:hypothetical protein
MNYIPQEEVIERDGEVRSNSSTVAMLLIVARKVEKNFTPLPSIYLLVVPRSTVMGVPESKPEAPTPSASMSVARVMYRLQMILLEHDAPSERHLLAVVALRSCSDYLDVITEHMIPMSSHQLSSSFFSPPRYISLSLSQIFGEWRIQNENGEPILRKCLGNEIGVRKETGFRNFRSLFLSQTSFLGNEKHKHCF